MLRTEIDAKNADGCKTLESTMENDQAACASLTVFIDDTESATKFPQPQLETEAPTQSTALPQLPPSASSTRKQCLLHKNRLQEYTQRSSLPLPTYQSVNEGQPHAPKFRTTVSVSGATYSSQNTFSQQKAAEQDAARVALECIIQKIKNEKLTLIHEDPVFCKSILNEFAVKMNLQMPTYDTVPSGEKIAVFRSSLVFNGVTYTGENARSKKVAEQLGARAAILSLLGDPAYAIYLSEIINSKAKLYSSRSQVKDLCNAEHGSQPAGVNISINTVEQLEHALDTHKGSIDSTAEAPPSKQLACHEFSSPKPEPFSGPVELPIAFVPAVSEQPLSVGENDGRKRLKNKRKANKKLRTDVLPAAVIPSNQASCSVAQ